MISITIDYYRLSVYLLTTTGVLSSFRNLSGVRVSNDPESFGKFGSYIQDGEMFLEREERVRGLLNRRRLSERGVEK